MNDGESLKEAQGGKTWSGVRLDRCHLDPAMDLIYEYAADSEGFMKIVGAAILAQKRFSEFQRMREGVDVSDRERLLLKVLSSLESRGIKGTPTTRLAALYNAKSLDRLRASESTISAIVISLEKREMVKRIQRGRVVAVELDRGGFEFLEQEQRLLEERLSIYKEVCQDKSEMEVVRRFYAKLTEALNRRMNDWMEGLYPRLTKAK